MNSVWKTKYLPLLTCLCGLVGFGLRFWLLWARDDAGFLPQNHPAVLPLWILTAITLLLLLMGCRSLQKAPGYGYNFPPSPPAGIGVCLGGIAIGVTAFGELIAAPNFFTQLSAMLGIGCVPVLIYIGICRVKGRRPHLLLHGIVCIYAMLHLIGTYQTCSANPHLLSYCFSILFQVCFMLALYFRTGFDAGESSRRGYTFFQLATVYFALVTLPGSENLLPAGGLLWMISNPCNLTPFAPERSSKS